MKKHTDAHRPDACALSKYETLVVWMIRNSGWNILLRKQHSKISRSHTRTKRCCVETEQRNVLLLNQPKISIWFPSQKSCQMAVPMLRMTVTTLKNGLLFMQHMILERCNGFSVSVSLQRLAETALQVLFVAIFRWSMIPEAGCFWNLWKEARMSLLRLQVFQRRDRVSTFESLQSWRHWYNSCSPGDDSCHQIDNSYSLGDDSCYTKVP